jgi:hypothetical protein
MKLIRIFYNPVKKYFRGVIFCLAAVGTTALFSSRRYGDFLSVTIANYSFTALKFFCIVVVPTTAKQLTNYYDYCLSRYFYDVWYLAA